MQVKTEVKLRVVKPRLWRSRPELRRNWQVSGGLGSFLGVIQDFPPISGDFASFSSNTGSICTKYCVLLSQ